MRKVFCDIKKGSCAVTSEEKIKADSGVVNMGTKYSISEIPVLITSSPSSSCYEKIDDDRIYLQTCSVGLVESSKQLISIFTSGDKVISSLSSELYKYEWKESELFPFSQRFPERQAGYIGFLAKALCSVRKAKVELGTKILVLGQGMQGIITAQAAGYFGGDVTGLDNDPERILIGKLFNIPQLALDDKDLIGQIKKKTNNYGVDVVFIECLVGDREIWRVISKIVRPGGSILVSQNQFNLLDISLMQQKSISLSFTTNYLQWEDYFGEPKIIYPEGYTHQDMNKDYAIATQLIANKKISVEDFERFCISISAKEFIEKGREFLSVNNLCFKLIFNQ